ncbi:MAG TPA: cell division protein FtsL [Actinomycetota bacterium]|nr:cell division protein FtsL [Actinomycetota bacterium]
MTALPHDAAVKLPRRGSRALEGIRADSWPGANPEAVNGKSGRSSRSGKAAIVPLRPVRQMKRSSFIVLVATLLSASLLALLLLNTVLSQGSFTRYELLSQANDLTAQEQSLSTTVAGFESPIEIERRAREMGMVQNENPVFLDLATGTVRGEPTPAPTPIPTAAGDSTGSGNSAGQTSSDPSGTAGGSGTTSGNGTNSDLGVGSPAAGGAATGGQPQPGTSGETPLGLSPVSPG